VSEAGVGPHLEVVPIRKKEDGNVEFPALLLAVLLPVAPRLRGGVGGSGWEWVRTGQSGQSVSQDTLYFN
jgi:hypothetical protein